jgi:hypothetical protein
MSYVFSSEEGHNGCALRDHTFLEETVVLILNTWPHLSYRGVNLIRKRKERIPSFMLLPLYPWGENQNLKFWMNHNSGLQHFCMSTLKCSEKELLGATLRHRKDQCTENQVQGILKELLYCFRLVLLISYHLLKSTCNFWIRNTLNVLQESLGGGSAHRKA